MAPPVAAADGIARVAARHAARISMSERGLVTRARRMVAAGHSAASASEHAATQGKGYVAETDLAASFAARVVNFGLSVAFQTVEDLLAGKPLEFMSMVGEAAKAGAKAFVRTTVVTYSQAVILLRRAKSAFSSRLIRAITSSTLVMSAVADVVVEFAVDFVAVIRGEMDGETLLRNLGVNTCGAIGSLAGAGIALAVARGAPWLLLLLAIAAGLWIGREAGRLFGGHIFGEANTGREAHESV